MNGAWKCLGLGDPAGDLDLARDAAHELLALVDATERRGEVLLLRWASSGTLSTPAASSRSAYSLPTPSMRHRSA
jgi:hypothetical protein